MASVHSCLMVYGVSFLLLFRCVVVCDFVHVCACVVCYILCGVVWLTVVCDVVFVSFLV